ADRGRIAVGIFGVATDRRQRAAGCLGVGHSTGEPAVTESSDATVRGLRPATDPDRQTPALEWFRLHAHGPDAVVSPRETHLGVGPTRAQQLDGFIHSRPACVEVLAQCLVFGLLPADADTEPNAAARQRVERAHLLGYERRLTLGKHEHLGAEHDA